MSVGEVHVCEQPRWPVATLSGEVDLSNVDDLAQRLESSVTNHCRGLVLDLSAVTYLDSTGLRLVYRLARQLGDRQQGLRLVVPPSSRILRVLTLAGVGSVATVVPNLASLPPDDEEELP
jgi:anti-anti-sigma factor